MDGTGWAFPIQLDARGGLRLVSGRSAVESCFATILSTVAGERVHRPELGIHLDWETAELTERLQQLLTDFEPRVRLQRVEVRGLPGGPELQRLWLSPFVEIVIDYELRRTGERFRYEGGFEWIP